MTKHTSHLAKGNHAFRQKNYCESIAHYLLALRTSPGMARIIVPNLLAARDNFRKQYPFSQAPGKVAVCSWELSHNAAGRAYTLAKLHQALRLNSGQSSAEVTLIGPIFQKYGDQVWEPVRNGSVDIRSFLVANEDEFLPLALEFVANHPFDLIHLSKPRIPNIILGVLYRLIWGATMIVDIDDEELSFVQADQPIGINDYFKQQGGLPELRSLDGQDWTRISVGLADAFDGITVSNEALRQRYGGTVVRHARDEKLYCGIEALRKKGRSMLGVGDRDKVVLFFGTPRKHKGLLEIAGAIQATRRQDIVFAIVGEFPKGSLTLKNQLMQKTGIRYAFLGNQDFDNSQEIAAAGDYCILLQNESAPVSAFQFPAKLSDALGVGLTTLVSQVAPLAGVIEAKAALPVSRETLAEVFGQLLANEDLAQATSVAALDFFQKELSFAANIPRLRQAMESVADERTPSSTEKSTSAYHVLWHPEFAFLQPLAKTAGIAVPEQPRIQRNPVSRRDGQEEREISPAIRTNLTSPPVLDIGKGKEKPVAGHKVAVVVHIYYLEIWPEIGSRLQAIDHPFDLFVTTPAPVASQIVEAVLSDFPAARISIGPNVGMDVLPFLSLCPVLVNEGYLAVCKLHTKKGDGALAAKWRELMLESLIGSTENFVLAVTAFETDAEISQIGPGPLFQSAQHLMLDNQQGLTDLLLHTYKLPLPSTDWGFFPGTMFWIRPESLEVLANYANLALWDGKEYSYQQDGNLEHALERMFGLLPLLERKKLGLLQPASPSMDHCVMQVTKPSENTGNAHMSDLMHRYLSLEKDCNLIRVSQIFDEEYYVEQCPTIAALAIDRIAHYLLQGSFRGMAPSRFFHPDRYGARYKDVNQSYLDPFVHYIKFGAREARQTGLLENNAPAPLNFRFRAMNAGWIDWRQLAENIDRRQGVSIVIPVFNQPELTQQCLESVYKNTAMNNCEVIVVDNGSDSITQTALKDLQDKYPSLNVVRHKENLNFALGCNHGASISQGETIIFLNNDTTVTEGWLEPLLSPLANPDIVAVQPRLLFPNGTIQCVGVVFSEKSDIGYPIYAGMSPDEVDIEKSRRYQAVTGACMAVRAKDFIGINGFDATFINGQEDIDLCLRLTLQSNRSCWYAASAMVYHHEAQTVDRCKYNHDNRRWFLARWAGNIQADDRRYYLQDDFDIESWIADTPGLKDIGISAYRPILARKSSQVLPVSVTGEIKIELGAAFPPTLGPVITLIRRIRPDLCELFPLKDERISEQWLGWLVTSGTQEYRLLLENEELRTFLRHIVPGVGLSCLQLVVYSAREDIQKLYPLPAQYEGFIGWFYKNGVEEYRLWPLLSTDEQTRLAASEPRRLRYEVVVPKKVLAFNERPFGVNLIGYAFGQLGIGEDLRMMARALSAAEIPFTIIDFPPGKDIPQNDRSMAAYVCDEGKYAFNVFCMTALEQGRFYAVHGKQQFEGRFNIGYWPWELSRWPVDWLGMTGPVDEVWVSTRHIHDALAPVSSVPVLVMPMAVAIEEISCKTRDDFGLPAKATLFCFSFDLNSSIHRKNPQACVDAFLMAFPCEGDSTLGREEVGLLIKAHRPARFHEQWERLKALAARDDRIHIIEETLSRPDLLSLYKNCDCFLSLHRAEGFGRGIAEALQLGLHVITTGYSGNVDFCYSPQSDLVRYRMVNVKKEAYPYGEGQEWAEADVAHAADLMREFVVSPPSKPSVPHEGWPEFSLNEVGARYRARLYAIFSDLATKKTGR